MPETFELCTELVRPGRPRRERRRARPLRDAPSRELWIRDVTITTGLVDTFTTPRLLKLIAEGRLDADAVRDAPLPARRDDGGVRHVRATRRDARAQGRARRPSPSAKSRRRRRGGACRRRASGRGGRPGRRHPPRRRDAAAAPAARGRRGRARRVLRRASPSRACYLRFHGVRRVDRALVEPFLDPDWVERGALVGTLGDERRRARSSRSRATRGCATRARPRSRSPSPTSSRGAASARGCSSSSRRAPREAGIERFVAEVLPENRAMLAVFARRRLRGRARRSSGGEVEVRFPIAPTRALPRARRRARPRRRRRLAAAVLRAAIASP